MKKLRLFLLVGLAAGVSRQAVAQNVYPPVIQVTTFSSLGTSNNGTLKYCKDCDNVDPCAGSGTGAFAFRVNDVWSCASGGGAGFTSPGAGIPVDTTGSSDWAARCLAAGTGVSIANACGAAGNITVSLDGSIATIYTSGTATPSAACAPGELYYETDANYLWACTSTNTWTNTTLASLDITGLTAEPLITAGDQVPFYDTSATANRKFGREELTQTARAFWEVEEDFIGEYTVVRLPFVVGSAGTASGVGGIVSEAGHPGILRITTGTDATGWGYIGASGANGGGIHSVYLGDGAVHFTSWVRLSALSDGTTTYHVTIGLDSCTFGAGCTPADGVRMTYTDSVNSGKWRGVCTEDTAATNVDDTGSAVAATTWYRIDIEVNAAASSAEFFVDGTSIGSCGSNVPDTNDPVSPNLTIVKTLGGSSRNFDIDAIKFYGSMTTTR